MLDATTGLLTITAAQFEDLQSLFFNIGGVRLVCLLLVAVLTVTFFLGLLRTYSKCAAFPSCRA